MKFDILILCNLSFPSTNFADQEIKRMVRNCEKCFGNGGRVRFPSFRQSHFAMATGKRTQACSIFKYVPSIRHVARNTTNIKQKYRRVFTFDTFGSTGPKMQN